MDNENCSLWDIIVSAIKEKEGETKMNKELINAVKSNKLDIVKLLLEKGADPNCRSRYGDTPLIYAIDDKKWDIAKLLLENGADPNCRSKYGDTPLIYITEMD